ncbi:MAG: hypothetical protein FDZ69_04650 [Deltaproteobacteria bacterium]|nr:MAG: hypothetical protein FDZ69_04650 [Deltaproteobacteria bacterium]
MRLLSILFTGDLPIAVFFGLMLSIWLWTWLPVAVVRVRRLPMGGYGMAFLNVILIRADIAGTTTPSYDYVYQHEYEHVRQMRRYSPWGVALFLGGWYFWQCLVKRKTFGEAWQLNPLEGHSRIRGK